MILLRRALERASYCCSREFSAMLPIWLTNRKTTMMKINMGRMRRKKMDLSFLFDLEKRFLLMKYPPCRKLHYRQYTLPLMNPSVVHCSLPLMNPSSIPLRYISLWLSPHALLHTYFRKQASEVYLQQCAWFIRDPCLP